MVPSVQLTGTAGDGRSLHRNATNLSELLSFLRSSTIAESMVRNLYQVEAADNDPGDPTRPNTHAIWDLATDDCYDNKTRAILRIEPSGTERFVPRFVVSSRQPAVESSEFPTKRAWSQPVGWWLLSANCRRMA